MGLLLRNAVLRSGGGAVRSPRATRLVSALGAGGAGRSQGVRDGRDGSRKSVRTRAQASSTGDELREVAFGPACGQQVGPTETRPVTPIKGR
jgi:hypothetical protein